ncbi:PH domain-containing protein [Colwellia hornerae]|nr:PH domain-containing protein [Colwellia hornerae]
MMQGTENIPGKVHFSNTGLTSKDLPRLDSLNFEMLSPLYAKSNRYITLFITLFIISILFIVQLQHFITLTTAVNNFVSYVIWVIALVGFMSTLYTIVADKRKFYALRQQDLSYQSGVIFLKTVSQPMLRIQHVELKRGPIDRKIGLAKLQVFSAGGALHTFEIPGLPLEKAESIRQFILDHKDVNHHG